MRTSSSLTAVVGFAFFLATGPARIAYAGNAPVAPINTKDGLAIKGFDPVAYFDSRQPTRGSSHYSLRLNGVIYQFSTAENLQRFKTNPTKFAPQYGGYCAYAMSLNRIADIDPARWAIVDGKLYLNNGFVAQSLWSLNKPANIETADKNWAGFPKQAVANGGKPNAPKVADVYR
jgi:YHS domain-containing protein